MSRFVHTVRPIDWTRDRPRAWQVPSRWWTTILVPNPITEYEETKDLAAIEAARYREAKLEAFREALRFWAQVAGIDLDAIGACSYVGLHDDGDLWWAIEQTTGKDALVLLYDWADDARVIVRVEGEAGT